MMCTCGHVRGAHDGTESCTMCSCSCFQDREMLDRWNEAALRLSRVEARLDALIVRLDVLQDDLLTVRRRTSL